MLNGPDGRALLVDFGLHRELDAREAGKGGTTGLGRNKAGWQSAWWHAAHARTPPPHTHAHLGPQNLRLLPNACRHASRGAALLQ